MDEDQKNVINKLVNINKVNNESENRICLRLLSHIVVFSINQNSNEL